MPDPEWATVLTTSLPQFFNTTTGSCTFVLSDNSVVECSKTVLGALSPVLCAYFRRGDVDLDRMLRIRRQADTGIWDNEQDLFERGSCHGSDSDEESDVIEDSGVIVMTDYYGYDDIVKDFLRSFYTGEITLNPETYHVTLKLACQYEVSWITSQCALFLEDFLREDNICQHFKFLVSFKTDLITSTVVKALKHSQYSRMIDHFDINDQWLRLDFDSFSFLLDHISPECELYTLHLLATWLEFDFEHRKLKFERLFQLVRLSSLPQDFLTDVMTEYLDINNISSTGTYKMILTSMFYVNSTIKNKKAAEQYPKIFIQRESYIPFTQHNFTITPESLQFGIVDEVIHVHRDTGSGKYYFQFSTKCWFVVVLSKEAGQLNELSRLLIPVRRSDHNQSDRKSEGSGVELEDVEIDDQYVSSEIDLAMLLGQCSENESGKSIKMAAIFSVV